MHVGRPLHGNTVLSPLEDPERRCRFPNGTQKAVHSHKRFMARSPILSLLRLLRLQRQTLQLNQRAKRATPTAVTSLHIRWYSISTPLGDCDTKIGALCC